MNKESALSAREGRENDIPELHSESSNVSQIMTNLEREHAELNESIGTINFDCFKLNKVLGRDNTFIAITYKMITDLPQFC